MLTSTEFKRICFRLLCLILCLTVLNSCFIIDYSLIPNVNTPKGKLEQIENVTYFVDISFDSFTLNKNNEEYLKNIADRERQKYIEIINTLFSKHNFEGELTERLLKSNKHLLIEIELSLEIQESAMESISAVTATAIPGWGVQDKFRYHYSTYEQGDLVAERYYWVAEERFYWVLVIPFFWVSLFFYDKPYEYFELSLEHYLFSEKFSNFSE